MISPRDSQTPRGKKVECLRVIQGEFEWPHILHEDGSFTGFIDFGGVAIGDPAADLHKLWELGEDFIDVMLEPYEYNTEDLKERSHFLALGHALGQMEMGYKRRREDAWSRGYRFFSDEVASPDRTRRAW